MACTEGGQGDPPSGGPADGPVNGPVNGSANGPVNGPVNGPLTGRLITTGDTPHRNALLSLDLQSGVYSYLDGADSSENVFGVDNEETSRRFVADHSAPGRFVETQYDCYGNFRVRCVSLWEAGAIEGRGFFFDVPPNALELPGTSLAKRSRDGRFVAFTDYEAGSLEVRTIDDELVSSADYGSLLGSPYDWLPDGSLLMEHDTDGDVFDGIITLARTEPGTARRVSALELPGRYAGRIPDLVVDPGGTRVAMLVRRTTDDSNDRFPIVLDLNTNAIHEPVAPGGNAGTLDAVGLHWSPDGQWLIFQNPTYRPLVTTIPISPVPGVGLPSSVTYAVRADGGSYVLPLTVEESNDGARIVVARPKELSDGPPDPGNAEPGHVWLN